MTNDTHKIEVSIRITEVGNYKHEQVVGAEIVTMTHHLDVIEDSLADVLNAARRDAKRQLLTILSRYEATDTTIAD